ncbi:hypothetical protein, partial [Herbaspirillum huttiense]
PEGSGPFGRIAALRIWVKTPSLDPNSRLALHPKRDSLALTPIYEMGSNNLQAQERRCRAFALLARACEPPLMRRSAST